MRFENRFRNIFFSINLIMTFEQTTGSRAQVWHGTAKKTSGGLTKTALMMNKHGRIVSRKKHHTAKKEKRLVKAGFLTKKGHFGLVKKGHKGSKKMRGGVGNMAGMSYGAPINEGMDVAPPPPKPMSKGGRRSRRMRGGDGYAVGMGNVGSPLDRALVAGGGRSRRMSGGMAYGGPLSPLTYDGRGVATSGVNLQFVAGSAS